MLHVAEGGEVDGFGGAGDVPRAVYEHAVICEYAHAQLVRLSARQAAAGVPADTASAPPGLTWVSSDHA
jgi:hypothetical protein